jgi:hypothetical protein
MAQGLMQLKMAVDVIQQALPNLAAGSEQHKDAVKAVQALSRHLPQGAPTAGVQQTQLSDLLRNTIRNALMQRLMMQRGRRPAGGMEPPPGGGGDGAMPTDQQPTPSTPLPGT